MDRQVAAASVQTVDHGGQAMTSGNLWQDAASWRVTLLSHFTFLHFIFFCLNIGSCFSLNFFLSLSVILCVLLFINAMLFWSLVN